MARRLHVAPKALTAKDPKESQNVVSKNSPSASDSNHDVRSKDAHKNHRLRVSNAILTVSHLYHRELGWARASVEEFHNLNWGEKEEKKRELA